MSESIMKVHQSAEIHLVLKELSGITQQHNSFSIDHKVRDLIAALTPLLEGSSPITGLPADAASSPLTGKLRLE